jgi:hypothetical protein
MIDHQSRPTLLALDARLRLLGAAVAIAVLWLGVVLALA